MYGISNYLFGAPFSLINAIILSIGIHSFGIFLINNYFSKVFVNNKLEKKKTYFGYLFGYNILLSVFYFFSVFTNHLKIIFIITSITCYIFFFVFIYKILVNNKKFKNNYQFFNPKNFFFLLLLFGYFLFSSGPITNADSLDYHAGVGLLSLINEKFTTIITWNTSLNSSSGEIFISFSFFNRTEQLASLTNFFALLSIFLILMTYTEKFSKNQIFFIFLLLSSPPILSLVSTIKPQLIFIASNLIAFVLLVENKKINSHKIFFILFFITCSFVAKYSFILSSSLIYSILILKFYKQYKKIILFSLIVLIFILLPHFYIKNLLYDMNLFEFIRYPVPVNIEGYDGFYDHLKFGGPISFPFNILHPLKIKFYNEGIGIFFLIYLIILLNSKNKNFFEILMIFIFFLPFFIFKNTMARYFLEIILFLSILLFIKNSKLYMNNFFRVVIILQSTVFFIILYYFGIIFFISSLNSNIKDKLMTNYANEYSIFKWSNSILPKDAVLLSFPRSISLSEVKTYSLDFTRFINSNNSYFWEEIKDKKPNFLLSQNKVKNKCITKLFAEKENVGFFTSRNIFQEKTYYNGYIYSFDYKKLPECFIGPIKNEK